MGTVAELQKALADGYMRPETLERCIETLRCNFMFQDAGVDFASEHAEQHLLQALSFLELAQRSLKLARLCEQGAKGEPQ